MAPRAASLLWPPYLPLLALAGALLSGQLLRDRAQRTGTSSPPVFVPSFAGCDQPGPCGPAGTRAAYLGDLISGVARAVSRAADGGASPVLLHIGVANFGNSARFSDIDLYSRVASLLPSALRKSYKLVLVEPNDQLHNELKFNALKLGVDRSQVVVVSGMVTDFCEGELSRMYRFSHQPASEFGIPFRVYSSWLSVERNFPVAALRGFSSRPFPSFNQSVMEGFRRFASLPNVSDYITEVKVPCFTPASLLGAMGASAGDLAMVVVDAENCDSQILSALLDLPGFAPGYLQWEGSIANRTHQLLGLRLQRAGFEVGGLYGDGTGDSDARNMAAVLAL